MKIKWEHIGRRTKKLHLEKNPDKPETDKLTIKVISNILSELKIEDKQVINRHFPSIRDFNIFFVTEKKSPEWPIIRKKD